MDSTISPRGPYPGAILLRRKQLSRKGREARCGTNRVRSVRVSRVCPTGVESEARFVISLSAEDGEHVILGTGTGFRTADEALGIAHEIAGFLDVKLERRHSSTHL